MIEDDEIGLINKDSILEIDTSKIIEKPVVCSALSSLMCDYGTSDEEIDIIKKPYQNKEICNVGKSLIMTKERELWRKNESISQQTITSNMTKIDLPNEVKNINEFGINIQEITTSQQNNSVTEIDVSSEIIQNQGDKGDLLKNNTNINDHSCSNGPDVTAVIATSDSSSKAIELAINNNGKPASSEKNNPKPYEDDDDSGPEEVKVDRNASTTEKVVHNYNAEDKTKIVRKKFAVDKRKSFFRKPKPRIPSTLIYRLLSKEMKQERNQVLQCIRYIRMNNYFDTNSS